MDTNTIGVGCGGGFQSVVGATVGDTVGNTFALLGPGAPVNGDLAPVPEPSTLLLFGSSLLGMGGALWRRYRHS